MSYLAAALIGPFFWLVTLSVALWLVRKFAPSWEKILWMRIPNTDPPETTQTSPQAPGSSGCSGPALLEKEAKASNRGG